MDVERKIVTVAALSTAVVSGSGVGFALRERSRHRQQDVLRRENQNQRIDPIEQDIAELRDSGIVFVRRAS